MKVLFVDDEEAVLSGLRRMLRRAADWECHFAVGGPAALDRLADEHFDVVVTDMRMPVVDGAGVLEAARNARPATVRIVLSGHNELASALRTVPLAHQFLTKPCDAEILRAAVNRAAALQSALDRTELLPIIGGVEALPSPPAAVTRLTALLSARDVDIDAVVDVVAADAAISAKLLQLVNSAFFGVARRVDDIRTAVRYLGIVTVRDLAVAVHAFGAMPGGRPARALVEEIHAHSTEVAELTQLLTPHAAQRPEAYSAALLHDVGRLVLCTRATDEYLRLVDDVHRDGTDLATAEREAFGADHAEVGALFLSVWGLPYPIVEVVLDHHRPRQVPEAMTVADATYLGDTLIRNGHSRRSPAAPMHADPRRAYLDEMVQRPAVAAALETWHRDGSANA